MMMTLRSNCINQYSNVGVIANVKLIFLIFENDSYQFLAKAAPLFATIFYPLIQPRLGMVKVFPLLLGLKTKPLTFGLALLPATLNSSNMSSYLNLGEAAYPDFSSGI